MNKDQKVLYIISFAIFAALLGIPLIHVEASNFLAACLLAVLTPVVCLMIRKRGSLSINKREVLLLSSILAVLYVILVQMLGMYFGYYRNPYFVNVEIFLKTMLPLIVIIITTEIIRYVLLAQKNKVVNVVALLTCVLAEVLALGNFTELNTRNQWMDLVGLIIFPALSANIYYHYVSKRFGAPPNIVFRLITALSVYFVPNITGISDALSACIKMFFPILMLFFVSAMYEKKTKNVVQRGKKLSAVAMVLSFAIVLSVAMLISCQFRFGALVIATDSMTGEINKGDMIIYELYDDQPIKEGQVIVFLEENQNKIVHRVIKIENVKGELRYYTKGDANDAPDEGYRTEKDIFALTDVKLSMIGYPTLFLKELLDGSN